jgi:hypothetical protein
MQRLFVMSFWAAFTMAVVLIIARYEAGSLEIGPSSLFALAVLGLWGGLSLASWWAVRKGRREIAGKMWLSATAFMMPYIVLDIGLGMIMIERLSPAMIHDDTVHHRLLPNTLSEINTSEFQYVQRVNRAGLRGAEVSSQKASGVYRILVLGDSFTMGKGVHDSKTFSVILQEMLNVDSGDPESGRFEVLNGGVDSYSPVLCYLRLKQLEPLLHPDFVVVNFDISDLLQESAYRSTARFSKDGEILGVTGTNKEIAGPEQSLIQGMRAWIRQHLFFTRSLVYWLDGLNERDSAATVHNTVEMAHPDLLRHTLEEDTADRGAQWNNVFDSLKRIRQYCDSRQIRFAMAIYPWGHQVNDTEWSAGRRLFIPDGSKVSDRSVSRIEAFAADENISLLNTYAAFRNYSGSVPLYYARDMHWTEAGHRLMASEMKKFLADNFITRHQAIGRE